ncbi:MAG: AlpA family phage regulatory protein [Pseudolabrys sp.]
MKTAVKADARLISRGEVIGRTGLSYPTIWQWMREGKFPRSRDVGGRAMWLASDIEKWILALPVRKLKGDPADAA